MNKHKFVLPFLAISLLASCGSPSEDTTYNFVFEGTACSINGQERYTEKIEKSEGRIYTIKTDNEYEELPEAITDIPDWVVYNRRNNKTSATLTINQMQADFAVKITATQYPIEIQFAESVGGPIIDTVQTYKGVKWSQVKKPTFEQDQYKVEGWSFDGTTPTGDIILDNYVFLDDAVVYPSYSYLCSLFADKESPYQIDRYSGKPGEDLVVSISAKPEQEAKFDLPTLEQFTAGEGITISVGEEETKIPLENVTYAISTRTSATLTIPHTLVSGKAVIAITAYQPEYEVLFINESADSHLDFEPVVPNSNEPSYVKKGDSYAFTVMVTGDSGATNPTEYLVPNNYSIYLGESRIPLNRSLYEVKPNSDRSQATVTIKENVIDGKVRISATAAQASCYFCEVISLGGIFPIPIQRVSTQEARHELQLTSAGGQFPYEEDIYVDNGTQALPITKYDNIEYDGENGIITIISAKENDSFTFILAAHGQPLLELANWDDIKTISENKYAPYFFTIGDIKRIEINGRVHRLRIIGFNHDYTDKDHPDETRVGITFEFANVLTNSSGEAVKNRWGGPNTCCYPDSVLNAYLNTDFLPNKIPDDLKNVIKTVYKETTLGHDSVYELAHYPTKLFPLSYEEMTNVPSDMMGHEGFIYQYYDEHDNDVFRIKETAEPASNSGTPTNYWLRSFPVGMLYIAGTCEPTGRLNGRPIIGGITDGMAPGFCI